MVAAVYRFFNSLVYKNLSMTHAQKEKLQLICLIVQRNLKILGNFVKEYLTRKNPEYLIYLSNVWRLIRNYINVEQLVDVKYWSNSIIFSDKLKIN
jgi:hypothetical protein